MYKDICDVCVEFGGFRYEWFFLLFFLLFCVIVNFYENEVKVCILRFVVWDVGDGLNCSWWVYR